GGLAGVYDYGPLGSLLKNNLKDLWIQKFVHNREDMFLLDSAIVMGEKPLTASGHVGGFSHPVIECKNCGNKERTDHLLENDLGYQNALNNIYKNYKEKELNLTDEEKEKSEKTFNSIDSFVEAEKKGKKVLGRESLNFEEKDLSYATLKNLFDN